MIGAKGGPTKSDIEEVEQWSDGGYICGGKIDKVVCSKEVVLRRLC